MIKYLKLLGITIGGISASICIIALISMWVQCVLIKCDKDLLSDAKEKYNRHPKLITAYFVGLPVFIILIIPAIMMIGGY